MSTATANKGLGKGLQALMSDSYSRGAAALSPRSAPVGTPAGDGLQKMALESLIPGKFQPRRQFNDEELNELANSLLTHGIMQPLVVRSTGSGYEIIAGERRWRAARLAKLKEVPVIIRDLTDAEALEIGLIENVQRKDLNPLEESAGYQRLIDEFHHTQEKLAKIVGKSRSHVANLLRLTALPEAVKRWIDSGDLSMGHARALLSARQPESLAKRIIANQLSVRKTEELIRQEQEPKSAVAPRAEATGRPSRKSMEKTEDVLQLEQMLSDNLGLKVSISTHTARTGEVIITYETLNELDTVLRRLGGGI